MSPETNIPKPPEAVALLPDRPSDNVELLNGMPPSEFGDIPTAAVNNEAVPSGTGPETSSVTPIELDESVPAFRGLKGLVAKFELSERFKDTAAIHQEAARSRNERRGPAPGLHPRSRLQRRSYIRASIRQRRLNAAHLSNLRLDMGSEGLKDSRLRQKNSKIIDRQTRRLARSASGKDIPGRIVGIGRKHTPVEENPESEAERLDRKNR